MQDRGYKDRLKCTICAKTYRFEAKFGDNDEEVHHQLHGVGLVAV